MNRAPTSAMRVAPLVMTTKLMVMQDGEKTISPMTKSPLITRLREAADDVAGGRLPLGRRCDRISRVVAMLRAETQQGGHEQHRGKGGEVERLLDPQRHH